MATLDLRLVRYGVYSLGERGEVLRSPCRSVISVKTPSERFEPFVHPVDVLVGLLFRQDILDDGVL